MREFAGAGLRIWKRLGIWFNRALPDDLRHGAGTQISLLTSLAIRDALPSLEPEKTCTVALAYIDNEDEMACLQYDYE